MMQEKNEVPTKELHRLINNFHLESFPPNKLEQFKKDAMVCVNSGADLTINSSKSPFSLLHCLIRTNKDGINEEEISNLLMLNTHWIIPPDRCSSTELSLLIDLFTGKQCTLNDFKNTAMLLAKNGANLSNKGAQHSPSMNLLNCLILNNTSGINNIEITELLKLENADATSSPELKCLTLLIDQFTSDQCSLDDFKNTAMLLAQGGIDLIQRGYFSPKNSLLHCLISTNKNGINQNEITELLKLNKNIVNCTDYKGRTVLTLLLNQYLAGESELGDFKKMAMLLAQSGDLTSLSSLPPQQSLFHCLVLTNANGINEQEIIELLNLSKNNINLKITPSYSPARICSSALSALIDQFNKEECSKIDFRKTALLLVRGGASLTSTGNCEPCCTLLHCLSQYSNIKEEEEFLELVSYLVTIDSNICRIRDGNGHTPLYYLLRQLPPASTHVVKKLVDIGGSDVLYIKSKFGETLLHTACRTGNLDVTKYLFGQGLDIKATTKSGRTALHFASHNDNQDLWQWLCEHIEVDAQDNNKNTVLHYAVKYNNKVMVKWLLDHKANICIFDKNNLTALSFAQENTKDRAKKDVAEEIILLLKANPKNNLLTTIEALKEYGVILKAQAPSKGDIAISVANELHLKALTFFQKMAPTPEESFEFYTEFCTLLNSKNKEMSEYASWSTIIANVTIALTGIGAVLLIARLIYSQQTQGRPLLFFQGLTTGEEKLVEIKKSFGSLDNN